MKKKVFFVISSFTAGGAERVFWLICQAFDRSKFDVVVVLLNTKNNAFSLDLEGIKMIDLHTIKASSSFFALSKIIRKEKPFAIYSTGGHINLLVSIVSIFSKVPNLIARGTNIPEERYKYASLKSKVIGKIGTLAFKNFDYIICQSKEMRRSWESKSIIDASKLVVIGNPILKPGVVNTSISSVSEHRLIIVARLSSVKGHDRLLDIINKLPDNYYLTIAGGIGNAQEAVETKIKELSLSSRITLAGEISEVCKVISQHNLFVLTSYTEGFPNVVLEALSVGTPVVTFRVGGVSDFIVDDFNGYIAEQGDTEKFREYIIKACARSWDHRAIAKDIQNRFSIEKIVKQYEGLIYGS